MGATTNAYSSDLSSSSRPQLYLQLQYLDLTDCMSLEDTGIQMIVRSCARLTCLYLRRCVHTTGKEFLNEGIAVVKKDLKSFNLFHLLDLGVKYLASYCPAFRELSISDCV